MQIANNLAAGTQKEFNPEAEMFTKVAAVYKVDFPPTKNNGNYDNGALQDLLKEWGRSDLAKKEGVGDTDIETISAVTAALNQESDREKRIAWLNQIYSITDASSKGKSESGAVENLSTYRTALAMVSGGAYTTLLSNFQKGIQTSGKIKVNNADALIGYGFACMGSCPTLAPTGTPVPAQVATKDKAGEASKDGSGAAVGDKSEGEDKEKKGEGKEKKGDKKEGEGSGGLIELIKQLIDMLRQLMGSGGGN